MRLAIDRWVALALLLATACSSERTVEVDVPDEVTVAGILSLDDNEQLLGASALEPWRDSLPVVTRSGARTLVVGYSDDQLAAFGPQLFSAGPLRPAIGCQNRLPEPAFAADLTDDGLRPIDVADVPALTTAVVESTCPTTTSTAWAVDVTCYAQSCIPVVSSTGPCTIELDLSACASERPNGTVDSGRLTATIDASGNVCLTPDERTPQCVNVEDPYSVGTLACGTFEAPCGIHVYRDARRRPPPFSIARTQWKPGADATPNILRDRAWIAARYLRTGYAFDMAMVDERLLISGPRDVFSECSTQPFEWTFIDPDTLQATSPVPAPACAQVLLVDPGEQTFVAPYFDQGAWRVGRFDRTGTELLSAAATEDSLDGVRDSSGRSTPIWRPSNLERSPDGSELWLVMYDSVGFEPLPGAAFIRLDATTLERIEQRILPEWHRSYSSAIAGGQQYALLAEWSYALGWFRLDRSTPDFETQLPLDTPVRNVHYTVAPLDADRMLVAALGRSPAIVMGRMGEVARMTHPAGELEQMMVRFMDWDGPIKLGIGLQTINDGRREAIATLLDTEADRFLPGVWVLGEGLPTRVVTDAAGRYFIALPWTAELVRLDPN